MFGRWPFFAPPYRTVPGALSAAAIAAVRDEVLASPYMAPSNLNARFEGTYGFSAVFRRDAASTLLARFPSFKPFLAAALLDGCNAFFLNPLLVLDGAGVKPHRDFSLRSYCPDAPFPTGVAVLYLQVPPGLEGGELKLYDEAVPIASVAPREGTLLTFRGDLRHEVAPVRQGAATRETARLSLVMEQYRLPHRRLAELPPCHIGSRGLAGDVSFAAEVDLWLDAP